MKKEKVGFGSVVLHELYYQEAFANTKAKIIALLNHTVFLTKLRDW